MIILQLNGLTMHSKAGHVFVEIEKKFIDETGSLHIDTTFQPGYHATVTGVIRSVPRNNPTELRCGDNVAFSYLVVYDQTHTDDRDEVFYEVEQTDPYVMEWNNGKKVTILRRYLMNDKYDAAAFDPSGVIFDQVKGSFGDIENWMSKFTFLQGTNHISYNNCHMIGSRDLWAVPFDFIYAIKKGDKILMRKDNVLIAPVKEMVPTVNKQTGLIEVTDGAPYYATPILKIAPNPRLKPGDVVMVAKDVVQVYNFWETDYLLVRQEQILAKILNPSSHEN